VHPKCQQLYLLAHLSGQNSGLRKHFINSKQLLASWSKCEQKAAEPSSLFVSECLDEAGGQWSPGQLGWSNFTWSLQQFIIITQMLLLQSLPVKCKSNHKSKYAETRHTNLVLGEKELMMMSHGNGNGHRGCPDPNPN